jgi:hypothetical protein
MDLTSVVERTKSMEQRLGISIQGVYANYEDEYLTVNFELHVEGGGQLAQDISIVAAAYDAAGRVIATQSYFFQAENVFGFVVGSIVQMVGSQSSSKIRLYPQKI